MARTKQTAIFHFAISLTTNQQHCSDGHIKNDHAIHKKCFMQILLLTGKTNISFKCRVMYNCILVGEAVMSTYFIFISS